MEITKVDPNDARMKEWYELSKKVSFPISYPQINIFTGFTKARFVFSFCLVYKESLSDPHTSTKMQPSLPIPRGLF